VPDAPVAYNDTITTAEDSPVTIAVLASDTDPDPDPGDTLRVTGFIPPPISALQIGSWQRSATAGAIPGTKDAGLMLGPSVTLAALSAIGPRYGALDFQVIPGGCAPFTSPG
jgi:hypothetical protein